MNGAVEAATRTSRLTSHGACGPRTAPAPCEDPARHATCAGRGVDRGRDCHGRSRPARVSTTFGNGAIAEDQLNGRSVSRYRRSEAAVTGFLEALQQALSCVTGAVLVRSHDSTVPGGVRSVAAPRGAGFMPLRGENRLHLSVALQYEVVRCDESDRGSWKVVTRRYMYHVVTDDLTEVILFHWHPNGRSGQHGPHLHVGSSQLTGGAVVSRKTHVPTGRVALESVLDLLIRDFGVVPLRADWEKTLTAGLERFQKRRTWS